MILLATSVRDGQALLRQGPDGDKNQVQIVTPRNADSARGCSVSHIYSTPAFDALDEDVQRRVLAAVYPAMLLSPCERCHKRWAPLAHERTIGDLVSAHSSEVS